MRLLRRLGQRHAPAPLPPTVPAPERNATQPTPNPDHAWKQLSVVNEWIRHSDAKAGATLAVTGVLATMAFNLSGQLAARSLLSDLLQSSIVLLLVATGVLCAWTLTPRIRDRAADPEVPNRLYFGSIAASFTRDSYRLALTDLVADDESLVKNLADQIHVNAIIAATKARCVKWAIRGALAAVPLVACLAVHVGATKP